MLALVLFALLPQGTAAAQDGGGDGGDGGDGGGDGGGAGGGICSSPFLDPVQPNTVTPSPAAETTVTDLRTPVSVTTTFPSFDIRLCIGTAMPDMAPVFQERLHGADGTITRTTTSLTFTPSTDWAVGPALHARVIFEDMFGGRTVFTWRFYAANPPPPPAPEPAKPSDVFDPQFLEYGPVGEAHSFRPTLYAAFKDNVGVDPSRTALLLDGAFVTPQVSTASRIEYTPPANLTPGEHQVYLNVRDASDNFEWVRWTFIAGPPLPPPEERPLPPETQEAPIVNGVATFNYSHALYSLEGVRVFASNGSVANVTAHPVAAPPAGVAPANISLLAYYEVSVSAPLRLDGGDIAFRVPRAWLTARNATAAHVTALEFTGGRWVPAALTALGATDTHLHFRATPRTLALLAVGADVTPPSILMTTPDAGGVFGAVPYVAFRASDNVALNYSTARALVDGATLVDAVPLDDGAPAIVPTLRPKLAEGPHTVTLTIADHLGLEARRTFNVSVDLTPPVIEVTSPPQMGAARPTLTIVLTDTGSGIDYARLVATIDGNPVDFVRTPVGITVTPPIALPVGPHGYALEVRDRAGNTASVQGGLLVTEEVPQTTPDPGEGTGATPGGSTTDPGTGGAAPGMGNGPGSAPVDAPGPGAVVTEGEAGSPSGGTLKAPSWGLVGLLLAGGLGLLLLFGRRPQ